MMIPDTCRVSRGVVNTRRSSSVGQGWASSWRRGLLGIMLNVTRVVHVRGNEPRPRGGYQNPLPSEVSSGILAEISRFDWRTCLPRMQHERRIRTCWLRSKSGVYVTVRRLVEAIIHSAVHSPSWRCISAGLPCLWRTCHLREGVNSGHVLIVLSPK